MADRALVIGVATYGEASGLDSHATIAESARRYGEVLGRDFTGPNGCRVLTPDVVADRNLVMDALEQTAGETGPGDRLLVVYVGHGIQWSEKPDVHLAVGTSVQGKSWTWLSSSDLYRIMRKARAQLKILIADCCYSDLLPSLGSEVSFGGLGEADSGTCVLTALKSSASHLAAADGCPELDEQFSACTPFSGHLLQLLRTGTTTAADHLTIGQLRDAVGSSITSCATGHSAPNLKLNGASDSTPIFPNRMERGRRPRRADPQTPEDWITLLMHDRETWLPLLLNDEVRAGDVVRRLMSGHDPEREKLGRYISRRASRAYGDAAAFVRFVDRLRPQEDVAAGGAPPPPDSGEDEGVRSEETLEWVSQVEVDDFVRRVHSLRVGQETVRPMPAQAMLAMREFATKREIGQLVDSVPLFASRGDALQALATAALRRTPEEAAELAVELLRSAGGPREGQGSLVRDIVHDVAGQRSALDVAAFLRACRDLARGGGEDDVARTVADWTVRRFASAGSGRTRLDKARLYIALCEARLVTEADGVMRGTLEELRHEAGDGLLVDRVGAAEFADALHTLSPSQPLLAEWIVKALSASEDYTSFRRIVAGLLLSDPVRKDELVEYVGTKLRSPDIVGICGLLDLTVPGTGRQVLRSVASRNELHKLAGIVDRWYRDPALSATVRELLAEIVRGGRTGRPRTVADLETLVYNFGRSSAAPECGPLLWRVAAEQVDGRSGGELVTLLARIERPNHRRSAEQETARKLAVAVLQGSAAPERFVEYVQALRAPEREADSRTAVFVACRQLADPEDEVWQSAGAPADAIARTAAGLHRVRLLDVAVDLLERCMENEQRMTSADMCAIVRRLTECGFPTPELEGLLENTLGRWADAGHRGRTVAALRGAGGPGPDAEFVGSLR